MDFKRTIESHPLIIVVSAVVVAVSITWGVADQLYIRYRDEQIQRLRDEINSLKQSRERKDQRKPGELDFPKEEPSQKRVAIGGGPFEIITNITKETLKQKIAKVRKKHGVRELTVTESGREISEVSPGTYFFLFSGSFRSLLDFQKDSLQKTISRFRHSPNFFEVHYIAEGDIRILGAISEEAVSTLGKLGDSREEEIMMSPLFTDSFNVLVTLPFSRIVKSEVRSLDFQPGELIEILDIRVR